jgi:Secretion system C-terminal sorting domain
LIKNIYILVLMFFAPFLGFGQGATCATADPFCSGSVMTFPAQTNNGTAPGGNNYGCLSTVPNPVWYYMQIDNPGNMTIDLTNNGSCTSSGCDEDFAIWGPYPNIAAAQSNCGSLPFPYDCSYDPSAEETITITGASSGDVFLLMITNYSNSANDVSFTNTSGSATTNCGIVLPVELTNFTGICNGSNMELNWSTASEINNDYFTIEKSYDAINYIPIGTIEGSGNSNALLSYHYVDDDVGEHAYYRLKQTDFDGAYKYYPPISISCKNTPAFNIYPNPFKDELTISVTKLGEYTLKINDYIGRSVLEKNLTNSLTQKIDLRKLQAQGVYFASLYNNDGELILVEKIFKQ